MELTKIIKSIKEIVRQTGAYIRQEAARFDYHRVEHKGFNDLVSYVDKTAEAQLVEALAGLLPEAGFLTEEGTRQLAGRPFTWVIDPLDGTTNFTHGLPVYSVSVALMQGQEVVAGVVYEINRDELFWALKDGGAYLNDQQIRVSPRQQLAESLLATGFPYYNFDQMSAYLQILDAFMQSTHGLRRLGSAAVDLAYVACGRFEGFFEYNLSAWDVAAGTLLVTEAGGRVTDFTGGNNYIFGKEIIAAGTVWQAMQEVISRYWQRH